MCPSNRAYPWFRGQPVLAFVLVTVPRVVLTGTCSEAVQMPQGNHWKWQQVSAYESVAHFSCSYCKILNWRLFITCVCTRFISLTHCIFDGTDPVPAEVCEAIVCTWLMRFHFLTRRVFSATECCTLKGPFWKWFPYVYLLGMLQRHELSVSDGWWWLPRERKATKNVSQD